MQRSSRDLVESFYRDVWNAKDEAVAREILSETFRFKGSLGPVRTGRDAFLEYWRAVHAALGGYHCEIVDLIATEGRAAARMRFSGRHQGVFFGVAASGKPLAWDAAAFFATDRSQIVELWVLGDIDGLKAQLGLGAGPCSQASGAGKANGI
jgi:predicted ester cyclase